MNDIMYGDRDANFMSVVSNIVFDDSKLRFEKFEDLQKMYDGVNTTDSLDRVIPDDENLQINYLIFQNNGVKALFYDESISDDELIVCMQTIKNVYYMYIDCTLNDTPLKMSCKGVQIKDINFKTFIRNIFDKHYGQNFINNVLANQIKVKCTQYFNSNLTLTLYEIETLIINPLFGRDKKLAIPEIVMYIYLMLYNNVKV